MADVRAQADAALALLLPILATKQATYRARVGRYWQGLSSHTMTPEGGTGADPVLTRKPTDQVESWANEGYSLVRASFSFTINVYSGPYGQGYEAVVRFRDGGGVWERTVNVGPETDREQAWQFLIGQV